MANPNVNGHKRQLNAHNEDGLHNFKAFKVIVLAETLPQEALFYAPDHDY